MRLNFESTMQKLSTQAIDLLNQLHSGPTLLSQLVGDDPRIKVVDRLGFCGDVSVVPHLAPFIFESGNLARVSIEAIGRLLSHPSAEQLLSLDEEFRHSFPWWRDDDWRRVKPKQVQRLNPPTKVAAAIFGVLSFHPSGHVREEALRSLSAIHDGSEIPYLLIRLNDWVSEVRDVSRRAVLDRFHTDAFDSFFEYLELVFRLKECGRDDHSFVVQAVGRRLISHDAENSLTNALRSPSRFVRRHSYRSSMSAAENGHDRLVRIALQSDDGVLRLWAMRDAQVALSDGELQRILPRLLDDSFMPVRREALNCVMQRFPSEAKDALIKALFDSSYSVRDFVRYHLRKLNGCNFAECYRQSLNRPEILPIAIDGLGETGGPGDARLLTQFLSSDRPRVRAAAVRSIGALDAPQHMNLLIDALRDENPKVANNARKALDCHPDKVEMARIADIQRNEKRCHVRLAAINLIAAKEFWSALPYLIEASADFDSTIAMAAQHKILRRVNRIFTSPTPEQRTSIANALNIHSGRLPARVNSAVQTWLGFCK